MQSVWSTRLRALPWALRTLGASVRARLGGEPELKEAALRFAKEHATRGDPESVLRALDRYAREQRFLMNVGDEKGPLLEDTVRAAGASARVLELGSFVGYSAVLMARNLGPEGRLTSIDVNPASTEVARAMAQLAGVDDRCEFLTGRSSQVIERLEAPYDVVFLDHWKSLYRGDMEKILERGLLRPGAVILADNLGPLFGANEYTGWMQAHPDFESELVESHVEYQELDDAVLVSRRRPAAH